MLRRHFLNSIDFNPGRIPNGTRGANVRSSQNLSRHRQQALSTWQVAVIAILAVVIAVGAYFLFKGEGSDSSLFRQPATSIAPPTEGGVPGEAARRLIRDARAGGGVPDVSRLFPIAIGFQRDGRVTDAHLLLFYLARAGHAESARLLAEMYDPLYYSSAASIMDEPDPEQAWKWYSQAARGGDAIATERLVALRDWTEDAAAQGNEQAEKLLFQWNSESGVAK
jgi:TPR repeat protein